MHGDLRIHLRRSPRLGGYQYLTRLLCAILLVVSLWTLDFQLLVAVLGLCLLSKAISALDPCGITLVCESFGQAVGSWYCVPPGYSLSRPCILRSHGRLASVLWIECRTEANEREPSSCRQMLVFPDAMSYEHWRLLRRELRLQAYAAHKGTLS